MTSVTGANSRGASPLTEKTAEAVEPALAVRGLRVEYPTDRGRFAVVDGVDFELHRGEVLGIVGESGSGKSVTSLAVMGLLHGTGGRITAGSIVLEGQELVGLPEHRMEDLRGDRIAMIFQEPMTSLNPAFTVGDQIAEVLRRHRGASRREALADATRALDRVGIPDAGRRASSYPFELSGGMRQRVMIAMAIACEPAVLIADEPTTALDVTIQAQILDLLADMVDELDLALLFITHNMGVVASLCDRVIEVYAGQVIEEGPVGDVFRSPLHPYTAGLLMSAPQIDERRERLRSISGSVPAPWEFSAGCRFAPRCRFAAAECESPIELRQAEARRRVRCDRTADIELRGIGR